MPEALETLRTTCVEVIAIRITKLIVVEDVSEYDLEFGAETLGDFEHLLHA